MRRRRDLWDARSQRERYWWPLLHPDPRLSPSERIAALREHQRAEVAPAEGEGVVIEGVRWGGDQDATT